jgi:hypothetical protein
MRLVRSGGKVDRGKDLRASDPGASWLAARSKTAAVLYLIMRPGRDRPGRSIPRFGTVAVEQHLGFDDQRRLNTVASRRRCIDRFRRQHRGLGRGCVRNVAVRSRIGNRKRRQCDEKGNDRQ